MTPRRSRRTRSRWSAPTGGGTLRLTYDPTKFSNGTVSTGSWQAWNAAAGTWYLDKTLNANGTTAPATTAPTAGGLQGGPTSGYTLAMIKSHCTATGNKVISHGIVAGPGWPATDTYADLVTFNTTQTDFLYDYAVRLSGLDRYQTAISASYNTFGAQKANGVVLARGDLFPDALSGVPVAGAYGGPLLLTPQTLLLPAVLVEIKRVLAPGGTVVLMGGTGALSANVETDLKAALPGMTVTRLAGTDRFDTSLLAAQLVQSRDTTLGLTFGPIMVATGLNFPDGLAAGPAALGDPASVGAVVLSSDTTLTSSVATYLTTAKANGTADRGGGRPGQDGGRRAGVVVLRRRRPVRHGRAAGPEPAVLLDPAVLGPGQRAAVPGRHERRRGRWPTSVAPMLLTWPTTLATTSASTLGRRARPLRVRRGVRRHRGGLGGDRAAGAGGGLRQLGPAAVLGHRAGRASGPPLRALTAPPGHPAMITVTGPITALNRHLPTADGDHGRRDTAPTPVLTRRPPAAAPSAPWRPRTQDAAVTSAQVNLSTV